MDRVRCVGAQAEQQVRRVRGFPSPPGEGGVGWVSVASPTIGVLPSMVGARYARPTLQGLLSGKLLCRRDPLDLGGDQLQKDLTSRPVLENLGRPAGWRSRPPWSLPSRMLSSRPRTIASRGFTPLFPPMVHHRARSQSTIPRARRPIGAEKSAEVQVSNGRWNQSGQDGHRCQVLDLAVGSLATATIRPRRSDVRWKSGGHRPGRRSGLASCGGSGTHGRVSSR